jgi:exopolysaccharide biosynthesis WecB/TagA/CpsF family protein
MYAQEKLLVDTWKYLPTEQKVVWIGVGASVDFLLGLQIRAPHIWQKMWLEWLYRLLRNPIKRWRRIYTAVVEFPTVIHRQYRLEKVTTIQPNH